MNIVSIDSKYNGSLTREQFLFYEMRTTARLMVEGLSDKEIIERIASENLFQYPTEREITKMAGVCMKRLHALQNDMLVRTIASGVLDDAKQVCLYAMMRYNRLVWDFMIILIGNKYKQQDLTFSKLDMNVFFMNLQEQNDVVAGWSDSTIKKIKQVLVRVLVENEYLDNPRSVQLNPVLISPVLENAIREAGLEIALPAFNCMA